MTIEVNFSKGRIDHDPLVLSMLKREMKRRRKHKAKATAAKKRYLLDRNEKNELLLLKAEETCRQSKAKIKRLHRLWEGARAITGEQRRLNKEKTLKALEARLSKIVWRPHR